MSKGIKAKAQEITLFILLFLIQGVWFFQSWPARLSPDSIAVVEAVRQGLWYQSSNLSYVLFVKLTSLNGSYIWMSVIAQYILLNAAVYFLLKALNAKFSLSQILFCMSMLSLFPHFGAFANTIWKDIPFAALSILGLVILITYKSLNGSIFGIVVTGIGYSFRLEGIVDLVIIIMVLLLLVYFKRYVTWLKNDKLSIAFVSKIGIAALVSVSLSLILPVLTNAQKSPESSKIFSQILDLTYVYSTSPEKLTLETRNMIRKFGNEEVIRAASDCRYGDPVMFNPNLNQDYLNSKTNEIFVSWLTESARNPLDLIEPRICRNSRFLPLPVSSGPGYSHWIMTGISVPNEIGLKSANEGYWLSIKVLQWQNLWEVNWKWTTWIGFHFELLLLYVFLKRRNDISVLILTTASLARLGSIFLFTPTQDARYAFLIEIFALSLLISGLLNWFSETKQGRKSFLSNK